jgi:hypothetical protein
MSVGKLHETLGGKTPNEVRFSRSATNEQPSIEPRKNWPRGSPCAKPQVAIDGAPGDAIVLGNRLPQKPSPRARDPRAPCGVNIADRRHAALPVCAQSGSLAVSRSF